MTLRDTKLGAPSKVSLTFCRTSPRILTQPLYGDLHPRGSVWILAQPLYRDTLPQSGTGSCQLLFHIPYLPGAASLGGHRSGTTSILFESAGHGQSRRKNQTQERRAQWFPQLSAARLKFTRKSTFLQVFPKKPFCVSSELLPSSGVYQHASSRVNQGGDHRTFSRVGSPTPHQSLVSLGPAVSGAGPMVLMHCPGLMVSLKALLSTQAEAVIKG